MAIATRKQAQLDTIVKLAEEHSVLAVAGLDGISSKALQGIRTSLRSGGDISATIKVAKNTLKELALKKLADSGKKDYSKLEPHIKGSCAFLFSNANPFALQKFLNQNQVPAPAKTGQISPVDVFIPEGLTDLEPGPVISELGSIGLQTRIEKGKIRIIKRAKVLSIGEEVSETVSSVLTRLGIQPFKVGLQLQTVLESTSGEIIDGSVLSIDEERIIADLQHAYMRALSLATHDDVMYIAKDTIPILLRKAVLQAMNLSLELGYVTENTIEPLLAKSSRQAKALSKAVQKSNPDLSF